MTQDPGTARDKMTQLLLAMVESGASDLHLAPGYRPTVRIHGRLTPSNTGQLGTAELTDMLRAIAPPTVAERLETERDLDCAVVVHDGDRAIRFRANMFRANGELCACLRHIPNCPPSFEWMGFPPGLARELATARNGLIIVTGITSSGKSTTLAGIVEHMNRAGGYRIITVEQPIEYVYETTDTSMISQREVGQDCASFLDGLKYGLRQDPDVILVGEIRDQDTAQMALSAAETGHLILTTMHTKDAKGAVTRFSDLFPNRRQDEIRAQLALNLRYVIAQHLLPAAAGDGKRVLAFEKMVANHPVRAAIRQGKIEGIDSAIQTGKSDGMIRLDDSLQILVDKGEITLETAKRFAKHPDSMRGGSGTKH